MGAYRLMGNIIDLILEYSEDIWPVENLYGVGQLAYVLNSQGDHLLADRLSRWKDRMEWFISTEYDCEKSLEKDS